MLNAKPVEQLIPSNRNPWYILATLHGEPGSKEKDIQVKNRKIWNKYYMSLLSEKEISLIKDHLKSLKKEKFHLKSMKMI